MFEDLIQMIRSLYKTEGFIPLHEPRFSMLDQKYVLSAIESTFVSSVGEYVNRFEQDLAAYVGAKRAVVTVNGTAALQVALRFAGVKADNEVITQPLTFVATANAIVYNGAHPVFIDVDRETMGLGPDALKEFLDRFAEKRNGGIYNRLSKRRIAAIVPMHTFGHPCRMDALMEHANAWGIPIVEDAAEALGSFYNGKHCGTFGKMGIFSFNGNKTITCGGGGAIVTDDEALAARIKHITTTAKISHPWKYVHDEIGYNFRMPNLNAALACAQLEQLTGFLEDKRNLAKEYASFFSDRKWGEFVLEPKKCQSNYWLNALILSNKNRRDELLKMTNEYRVMTRPIWRLMSDLQMFQNCQTDSLKNSKWLQERVVNLPSSVRL
ncbi:LegC family aminotransferase [Desulfonema magnum]|uniref:GDP-perosamine synthase n=1 Tax=Desulfonema magnum TaxID=45655 RepID=A0A975GU32_9BACT|nr:LegC family aminotransferase [Desulfonema magnum]QTA93612.1 Aminotransferase family protein [Desulfonema magnum]